MRIETIKIKSGQIIKLNKISVLVGANNVGKSQTLRDIQQRMQIGLASKPVLLDEINFKKPENYEDLFFGLLVKDSPNSIGNKVLSGINTNLTQLESFEFSPDHFRYQFNQKDNIDFVLGNLSKFKVSHLDASSRLQLVKTTSSFNPDTESPQNIIQNLFNHPENETLLKRAFNQAFNMDIMLDYSGLKDFCLRVAKSFPEIPEDPRKAYLVTKQFNIIDNQGDGFRSFVGIILSILFSKDRIVLLDEPEAFLHPAQARFLGKWIADNSELLDGQLLIATHNANFLNGILSSNKYVDIYRLNRNDDETIYNLIPPDATEKLAKSPMLSSQRILESIFHKGVVVCEADADRTVYQSVASLVHNNQEVLFVHSHNKQTLKDVASLLIDAKIPVVVVSDIDLLNDENDFKQLIETLSGTKISSEMLGKRDKIAEVINKLPDKEVLDALRENLKELLGQLENNEHSFDGAKGAINRVRSEITKWKSPKNNGIEGFPTEIQELVANMIIELKDINLFIVPVGELEGWMKLGTTRKNKWIILALDEIFSNNSSDPLNEFVKELINKIK